MGARSRNPERFSRGISRAEGWIADSWFRADVAQLVEHSLGKGEVTSSILVIGSRDLAVCFVKRAREVWFRRAVREGHGFSRAVGVARKAALAAGGSGSNSVVESQPSKLLVAGSIPVSRSRIFFTEKA